MKLFAFRFSDALVIVRATCAEEAVALVRDQFTRPALTAADAIALPLEGPAEVVADWTC